MSTQTKNFFFALAIFANTIIGVGIFGLPYTASKAGFGIAMIYLAVFCLVVILISLAYAEICFRETTPRRFPGYAQHYFGKKMKHFAFLVEMLSLVGALVSYIIVGGVFLNGLLGPLIPGNNFLFSLLFFALGAVLVLRGSKAVAKAEVVMFGLLVLLVAGFALVGFGKINWPHYELAHWPSFFLPYGITIFSLWGISAIPELGEISRNNAQLIKRVLVWGVIISALVYALFIFLTLGITGQNTTADSLTGLADYFPPYVISFGYFFGFLAVFTSFIMLALHVKATLQSDYRFPPLAAWLSACFVPLLIFLAGVKNFIEIINFSGSLALGLFGVLLFAMFLKIKDRSYRFFPFSHYWAYPLIAVFLAGIALEVAHLLGVV